VSFLDIEKFSRTEAQRAPFEYVTVPAFVTGSSLAAVNRDFPKLEKAGNFPLDELDYGPGFAAFIEKIKGPEFRMAVQRKFNINLEGLETRLTVRGFADPSDGGIHTDICSKVVTGLIYLNDAWESPGGRLRLLRNAHDIEDYVAEVPPVGGTLFVVAKLAKAGIGEITRALWPLLAAAVAALLVITYVPSMTRVVWQLLS